MRSLSVKLCRKIILAVGALFFLYGAAHADDLLPTTHTLEELVSRWVELKNIISTEKKDWREARARIEAEYNIFQKEKLILEEEIRSERSNKSALTEEKAGLIIKKEALAKALDRTKPDLIVAERDLKKWRKRIPHPLAIPLEPLFARLNRSSKLSVSQRLQIILSLYGEIENLQNDILATKEILTTKASREREFDVIYLGLARGFCVSEDNGVAGIGRPTQNGWEWRWDNGLGGSIRQTLDYYNRERSADFIKLPLGVIKTPEFNKIATETLRD